MQERIDQKDELILEEKKKRRATVAKEVERRKAVEQMLDDLYKWVGELHDKIETEKKKARAARKDTKAAELAKAKADTLSSN